MGYQPVTKPDLVIKELPNSTRLTGLALAWTRFICAGLVLTSLGLFGLALPVRLTVLRQTVEQAEGILPQISALASQAAGFGPFLDYYPPLVLGLETSLMLLLALNSVILWSRKSTDWLALFLTVGMITYGNYVIPTLDALLAARPGWQFYGNLLQAIGIGCALTFLYIFPDGHFVPRWTRLLSFGWIIWGLLWVFQPNSPFNIADPFGIPSPLWFIAVLGWWTTGLFAQIYRYQYVANPVQRQQTKLTFFIMAIAIFGYGVYYLIYFGLGAFDPTGALTLLYRMISIPIYLLFVTLVPLSITFSILRYRLWDIDLFINRTIIFGLLTGVLILIYFSTAFLIQSLLQLLTGQSQAELATAFATLVLAATFQPVRERIQNFVDQQFYRTKYDMEQTLAEFGATIRREVNLIRLTERLEIVILETIEPIFALTWLWNEDGYCIYLGDESRAVRRRGDAPQLNPAISPDDPLVLNMGTAAEVIELKRLTLDSPATQQLNEIQVEMIVPFFSQGELIGWLGLGPRRNGHGYSSHAKELMKKLATQIGPAIQVAQLLRQRKAEARRRERLTQEMQVARIIQQTLLPRHLPDLPGCQIAAHYRPVRAVGGDFYDFMFLPDGRVGFVIGDVSDTGIPAALLMATTRAILRTVTSQQTSPGEVLARANDLVFHDIPPKMFVTCICAIFEPSTGYLRYANAGHNPPYCRSAGGIEGLTAQGVPLGLMPEVSYEEKEATIAVGDQLIFYSDGLTQARNAQGANFGSQRLYDLLADQSNSADKSIEPAEAFIDFLLDEWSRFTGSDWQQEDDMTLVIIEHVETKNFVARPDAETASPQAQFDKYR